MSADAIMLGGLAATIASAHSVGLIDALVAGPGTAAEHADRLDLDTDAVALVLDALRACGVAQETGGRYAAAPALEALDATMPGGVGAMGRLWAWLPRLLRTGRPAAAMDGDTEERAASYRDVVGGLGRLGERTAVALAARLVRQPVRILDVGAGSGVWSLAMAARSRTARVTALDLGPVLSAFRRRAETLGLADRVDTMVSDYHAVELPAGEFDRIVAANVLHLETPDGARSLVERLALALAPAGELVIVDVLGSDDPARDRARAIYALHLALRTTTARNHSQDEITRWCRDAGLTAVERIDPDPSVPYIGALVARRSA